MKKNVFLFLALITLSFSLYSQTNGIFKAIEEQNIEFLKYCLKKGADPNQTDENGNVPLAYAIFKQNKEIAKILLDNGAKIIVDTNLLNWADYLNNDAIYFFNAIRFNDIKTLNRLIEKGFDVNYTTAGGLTPLHYAAFLGREPIVNILINNGANVNAQDNVKFTPIFYAIKQNHSEIVKILINNKADVNIIASGNQTPLHFAIFNDNFKIVDILLKNGANPNQPTDFAETLFSPLMLAFYYNYADIFKDLINHGADLNFQAPDGTNIFNIVNYYEKNFLHFAVELNNPDFVKIALQKGIDPNAKDEQNNTPLHLAAKIGNNEIIAELLKFNVKTSLNDTNNFGLTPLLIAVNNSFFDIAKEFIANGAEISNPENKNSLVLLYSVEKAPKDFIDFLLKNKVLINVRNSKGQNALHLAVLKNDKDLCQTFIEKGININQKDNQNSTPLLLAAKNNFSEIAILLLDKGANPNIPTNLKKFKNWYPLHFAVDNNNFALTERLIKAKANPNLKNYDKKTPIDLAIANGNLNIVKFLYQNKAKIYDFDKAATYALISNNQEVIDFILSEAKKNKHKINLSEKPQYYDNQLNLFLKLAYEKKDNGIKTALKLNKNFIKTKAKKSNSSALHLYLDCQFSEAKPSLETVKLLISKGAKVNETNIWGATALHYAAKYNLPEIAEFLLKKKAKINQQLTYGGEKGFTPLHFASKYGANEMVDLLLKYGANPKIKDANGKTPSDYAKNEYIKQKLLNY